MWRYPPSWRCDQTCGPPVTTWWVLFDLLSHQKWRQRTSASLGPKLTQRVLESLLDHNRLPSYCCQRGMVHVCRLKRSTTFYFPISVGLQDLTYFFFSKLHGYLKHCHRCFVTREKDFYSLGMLQPQWVCRVSDLSLTTDTWKQRTESGQRIRSWALVWAQPVITVQHTADLKRSSLCSDVFKNIAEAGRNLFFYSPVRNHSGMRLSPVV